MIASPQGGAILFFKGVFSVIRNLTQQAFRDFGKILTEKSQAGRYANHHSIPLTPQKTYLYQTVADTWLTGESGGAVLSVSLDNETYQDFYLDTPVWLRGGVWFSLTSLRGPSSVELSAYSMPRLLSTSQGKKNLTVRPGLQITALYTFFYQEKERGFLYPGGSHSLYELTYVDRDRLHCVADGQDLLLQPGEMVLYDKNQWHMQYADVDVAPRFITITFDAQGADLSALAGQKYQIPRVALPALQLMLREQENPVAHSADMILSLLQILLITLLRQTQPQAQKLQPANSLKSENETVRRAQQYITRHVREKLSVPEVAKNVDVSPSYLTSLFHKHLQISPGEYIRRIKLQESKQMIREGALNFTQIADALQYSTVHHFSRQFKEKFGITPTEYAKSVR